MKYTLFSLSCIAILHLTTASPCHASECRPADADSTLRLPSASRFMFKSSTQRYHFLPAVADDFPDRSVGTFPSLRAKRLRGAATVFFVITGFPFLPAGIGLAAGGDSMDAIQAGAVLTGLSMSFLVYGILMFIHADIIERAGGSNSLAALSTQRPFQEWCF